MSAYSQAVLNMTPVAYWRLGEPAGTVAIDQLYLHHGTYVGAPTLAAAGLLSGDSDTAVTFNGTTQNVALGVPLVITGVAACSVLAWVNSTPDASFRTIFAARNFTDGSTVMLYSQNGSAGFIRRTSGGGSDNCTGPALSAVRHCVVGTYDGSNLRWYVDGGLVAGPIASSQSLTAATDTVLAAGDGYLAGTLDEVAAWSRALTVTEVAALYQQGSVPRGIAATMTALATATGLGRVYDWPTDSVNPPATVVSYPELDPNIVFDGNSSGKGENLYPVYVLAGTAADRSARTLISGYVHTIPPLLNAVTGGGIDYVNVETVTLREVAVAGNKYLGAVFSCRVMEAL